MMAQISRIFDLARGHRSFVPAHRKCLITLSFCDFPRSSLVR